MTEGNPNADYDPERLAAEAAETDPAATDATDPEHDPYLHLRPHQWKKGQSGNPGGKKKGTRSLGKRLRDAGSIKANELEPFRKVAEKLGMSPDVIKRMDVFDVFTLSMLLHGVRGRTGAMVEVAKHFGPSMQVADVVKAFDGKATQLEKDRAEAEAFYKAIIAADDVPMSDKVKARTELDKIQGLVKIDTPLGAEEAAQAIRDALGGIGSSMPAVDPEELEEGTSSPLPSPDSAATSD